MNDFYEALNRMQRAHGDQQPMPGPRPLSAEERREAVKRLRVQHGLDVPTADEIMKSRRVPKIYWQLVEHPKETMALTYARALHDGKGVLLLLQGNKGCGKSTAAAWVLRQRPGLWVDAPDLERPPTSDGDATDHDLATTPFLVIDDLGTEYSTDKKFAERRINVAISKREANLLPTLLTANISTEEFKARYGDRIASRINGDPLGWQSVDGPDLRMDRHNHQPFNERGEK